MADTHLTVKKRKYSPNEVLENQAHTQLSPAPWGPFECCVYKLEQTDQLYATSREYIECILYVFW